MKKVIAIVISCLILLSSCGTTTGTGAYVGGQFGNIIGSAVGGLTGGKRGSDLGSLIGTIGGATAGAAIGAAIDRHQYEQFAVKHNIVKSNENTQQATLHSTDNDSGYDPKGHGDDRIDIDFGNTDTQDTGLYATASEQRAGQKALLLRNATFTDANGNGLLGRNEECRVSFEIMNNTDKAMLSVQPTVTEITGNKHVHISPNLCVERIEPRQGVRYTATVLADNRLKDGEIIIRMSVTKDSDKDALELTIPTQKQATR